MDAHDLPARAQVDNTALRDVPARLMASWQRSQTYGISLEEINPVFSGTYDDESLFYECGRQILADLHSTLSAEPVGLMLTDADGLVLNRISGDTALLQALDQVHLAPGFTYSEREVGTNGLGLALADRVPTLVRADDHYTLSLCGYTCAAAPVFDPQSGRLEGAINLTTWSDARPDLLLALAQSAATSTANLMLARATGHRPRRVPRGHVFRVEAVQPEPGSGSVHALSDAWNNAVAQAAEAVKAGRTVAAVGEWGSGRATVLAQAQRLAHPRDRLLAVRAPEPHDIDTWLSLWTPELSHADTGVVICNVDELPDRAAHELHDLLVSAHAKTGRSHTISAERFDEIPKPLSELVDTVVHVPSLRERPDDILPLAEALARRARGRPIDFTPAAVRILVDYAWPGNVTELYAAVKDAASRTDIVDAQHLPPEMLARSAHLPRIRAFEREEMVRVLTRPGVTIENAARELGMSRAPIYRKLAQYGIQLPRH